MPSPHHRARHEFKSAGTKSTFRVVEFVGDEAISQTYRFVIDLVSDDPNVELADVIDQAATLTMYRGEDPAPVHGIVTSFQLRHESGGQSEFRYGYRAVLEPRLSRLRYSTRNRVFQNQTVEEITSSILLDAGVDSEFTLKASYAPREYTTQYKETDLAFVQRLFEFEGIRYSFTHDGSAEMLVVSDTAADAQAITGDPKLPYSHADGLRPTDSLETIRDFLVEQHLVTAATRIKDVNYRTPEADILGEETSSQTGSTGVQSEFGMHAKTPAEAKRLARVRAEEIESARVTATGTGDCLRFRAGQTVELADHYRDGVNQKYLLTAVRHVGGQPDAEEAGSVEEAVSNYSNTFSAVPASVPYRPPRRTPVPKLPGILTATVEGSGNYAPVDDQGRYRVRMPFDLGNASDGQASKAVRLAQPNSGAGSAGQHFPVHADSEMVVACVDGDVDRILGLATVPSPANPSPVTSANSSQHVLRTTASNEFVIDDKAGGESIKLSTPNKGGSLTVGAVSKDTAGAGLTTQGGTTVHGASSVNVTAWSSMEDGNFQKAFKLGVAIAKMLGAKAKSKHAGDPISPAFKTRLDKLSDGMAYGETVGKAAKAAKAGLDAKNEATLGNAMDIGAQGFGASKLENGLSVAALGVNQAGVELGVVDEGQASAAIDKVVSEMEGTATMTTAKLFTRQLPSVSITAPGNIECTTLSQYSVEAAQGFSVLTAFDAELGALKAINLHSGQGVDLFAYRGGIRLATKLGKVQVGSDTNTVSIKAEKDLSLESASEKLSAKAKKDIKIESTDESVDIAAKHDVLLRSFGKSSQSAIMLTAEKGFVTLESWEDMVRILSQKGVEMKGKAGAVEISSDKEISLKVGGNSIVISKTGIDIKVGDNASIGLKQPGNTTLKGVNIAMEAKVGGKLKGAMVNLDAQGVAALKGALTKAG